MEKWPGVIARPFFIFHHEVKTTGFSRLALAALFFKLSFMR